MFREKIKELLAQKEGKRALINEKTNEMRQLLSNEDATDEDLTRAKSLRSEIEAAEKEVRSIEDDLKLYRKAAKGNPAPDPHKRSQSNEDEENEEKRNFNAYLHQEQRDGTAGITSPDVAATIPESILYNPENEVKSVTDLSQLVTQFQATTASGKYPVLKRATERMNSVEELQKNPELAKPEFEEVDWKVSTYRGAIPLSQESIDDSAIDLTSLVAMNANEQKINTTNFAIAAVLKAFTAKTVAGESVDDIKHILNVNLDPAYNKMIIASQSFYQYLDTLKDKNGQYLLHEAITDGSPRTLLGVPVTVVEDELLGAAGEAHAFIGDLARAVLYANRKDIQVRWVDNDIYGQYLQAVTRFDVKAADKRAGYFVTGPATLASK
ncbi:phage major capsid protein [Limosilactobacillus reuteri]|uniref:phage major capsid protein n=1 Tax=Limosilactobacillus reuteri TaxID=1598 RepID=UPI000B99A026|nr:phage major capsid protein [Limosilactobacillus reuteri]OYS49286.1 phage major capsid protein [Limosilactobacillus reuteri]OYS50765.1 phage major capsid protein [Limosilactobacillus reuteri]OYS55341.1 phage major capsid protein [Limosilactobacillus reuteri]OYS56270.1 phage major capsid protein [Limosilactobacillus reuteri]OYS58894.1 phage major capsid protein [Limosilactobacillus reuteri]